jgi:hypothetical protein
MSEPETPKEAKEARVPKSLFQKIQEMPVSDKVKLAMTGDKEARTLLLKDNNKQIQDAVLSSPQITDAEIVAIANSRTISEELLRKVADNRVWVKNYQVRLGLVNNPKTPVPISLKLVRSLMLNDLKRLAKSKAVPSALVQVARREVTKRGA